MITEDYVSFETAKLLKEKGFDESIKTCYHKNKFWEYSCNKTYNGDIFKFEENEYSAPTLQMAMKWLREEKGITIVPIVSSILDNEKFLWDVEIIVAKTNKTYYQGWVYEQYEEAVEAAIKYCLTNLI